ncbi:hypothetical protein JKP88DRAFT_238153 [Tribonema minus]|uniref:Uncharacterized protein n=1 Tax=Tribonema minus TaxID=303371 RepID=A0A835Z7S4_9STRA|nr:hypothetical protein JKP88DRAFT_238153 [Tribonema minus]
MKFVALIVALCLACASAFVTSPVNSLARVSAPKTQAKMSMSLDAFATALPQAAQATNNAAVILAEASSKAGDFGGYVGPVAGLLAIGALILVLSPPLVDN